MTKHIHFLAESVGDNDNLAYFMKSVTQRHAQYIIDSIRGQEHCGRVGLKVVLFLLIVIY